MPKPDLTAQEIAAIPFDGKRSLTRIGYVRGLYLEISLSGKRTWQFRYTCGDKRRLMALGDYETVTLTEAIEKARKCRHVLKVEGRDPLETDMRMKPVIQQHRDFITSLFGV